MQSVPDHMRPVWVVCLLWLCLYLLLCLLWRSRSYEWNVRVVTMVHAILVSYLSWVCSYDYGPWPFTDPGGPNTDVQEVVVTISLGYFLFDFCWCLYFKTEGPVMLFHHLLSIAGLGTTLCTGFYGCEIVAVICGTEVTNPLLQLRWFLRETGRYNTILGEVVDHLFMTLFGIMRLGVGSYLLYTYMTNPKTDYIGRTGGILIYLVGWIFWVSIVQFAIKKYSKKWNQWKVTRSNGTEVRTDSPLSCEGCRESQGVTCVKRVNKVIQDINKSTVDTDTVEAIKNLSTSNQESIKKSL